MREVLVCAATAFEGDALPEVDSQRAGSPSFARLVCGAGAPETLVRLLSAGLDPSRFDLVLNIGIAGAYPETGLRIGDIVIGDSEIWGDTGFALPEAPWFRSVTESPFGGWYAEPLPCVHAPLFARPEPRTGASYALHTGKGCTVSACTGTEEEGLRRRDRTGAIFETMEGAAVAAVARQWGIPFCEVRAISNIAARRDMRPENIRLAIESLKDYLTDCLLGVEGAK